MIGRLDAPGAKLEPVMPGLGEQEIAERARRRCGGFPRSARTVTVANWSVTTGSTPCWGAAATASRLRLVRRVRDCGQARRGATRAGVRDGVSVPPHDRAWRRHGDFRQLCREDAGRGRALGHRGRGRPRTGNSQLAPPTWNARLLLNVIVPILIPSCDGSISIIPWRIGRVSRGDPLRAHQSIDVRRREGRGTGMASGPSSDERTRRRSSDKEVRPPAAAATAAVPRTARCWPAR